MAWVGLGSLYLILLTTNIIMTRSFQENLSMSVGHSAQDTTHTYVPEYLMFLLKEGPNARRREQHGYAIDNMDDDANIFAIRPKADDETVNSGIRIKFGVPADILTREVTRVHLVIRREPARKRVSMNRLHADVTTCCSPTDRASNMAAFIAPFTTHRGSQGNVFDVYDVTRSFMTCRCISPNKTTAISLRLHLRRYAMKVHVAIDKREVVLVIYTGANNLPQLTHSSHHSRQRALLARTKRDTVAGEQCQLREWWLNLTAAGLSGIITPLIYQANICSGTCDIPLGNRNKVYTNHAYFTSHYHLHNAGVEPAIPRACCVPVNLHPLLVVESSNEGVLSLKSWSEMVVARCGCV